MGAVRCHSADGVVVRDLVKQVRQDGAIAFPLGVNLTSQTPDVAMSMARWTLRPLLSDPLHRLPGNDWRRP